MTKGRAILLIFGFIVLLLVAGTIVFLVKKPKAERQPSREEYIRTLIAEVRKVQEGGNWIRIGTNGWFYFIGITEHREVITNGYGKVNGDFIVRDCPSGQLSSLAIGIDHTGKMYFSEGVCYLAGWPAYTTRWYQSMEDFLEPRSIDEPWWVPLPKEFTSEWYNSNKESLRHHSWPRPAKTVPSGIKAEITFNQVPEDAARKLADPQH